MWTNPVQAATWTAVTSTWTAATATRSAQTELAQGVYRDMAGATLTLAPALVLPLGRVGVEVDSDHVDLPDVLPLRRPRISGTLPAGLTPVGATAGISPTLTRSDLVALCDRLPPQGQGGQVSCMLPTALEIGTRFTLLFDGAAGTSYPGLTVSLAADNLPRTQPVSTTVTVP